MEEHPNEGVKALFHSVIVDWKKVIYLRLFGLFCAPFSRDLVHKFMHLDLWFLCCFHFQKVSVENLRQLVGGINDICDYRTKV
jgi:hypothetical protein